MFHLLMGLSGLLATYVLILILVWIPLRNGQRWAWFAIAAAALIVHGGQWVRDVVTDGGLRNYTVILGSGSLVFAGAGMASPMGRPRDGTSGDSGAQWGRAS